MGAFSANIQTFRQIKFVSLILLTSRHASYPHNQPVTEVQFFGGWGREFPPFSISQLEIEHFRDEYKRNIETPQHFIISAAITKVLLGVSKLYQLTLKLCCCNDPFVAGRARKESFIIVFDQIVFSIKLISKVNIKGLVKAFSWAGQEDSRFHYSLSQNCHSLTTVIDKQKATSINNSTYFFLLKAGSR